jgi:hypothetical protein
MATQFLSAKVLASLTHLSTVAIRNTGRKRNWRRIHRARGELLFAREDVEVFVGYRFPDDEVRANVDRFSQYAELVE